MKENLNSDYQKTGLPKLTSTLLFMMMLYFTLTLVANATFSKVIKVVDFVGVGGEVVLPLIFLIEDIIAEVYGYRLSRTLLWYVMLAEFIFSALILFIIHLPSPHYWQLQADFNRVFGKLIQVGPVAIIAVILGRFLNIYLITKMKVVVNGKYFWFRSVFSSSIGGGAVAFLYYFIGFHGIYPLPDIFHMFLSELALRISYAMVGGIPAILIVIWLKRSEKVDIYDISTNFNPFKLSLKQGKGENK